ncbi:unnamed protein product, partial [Gongylonema pulchrum]|uniref:Lysis protein n=1 Tax=Gongylonema pulchrum TaxID=637853 RepID=A0A183E131_9BILA
MVPDLTYKALLLGVLLVALVIAYQLNAYFAKRVDATDDASDSER